MTKRFFLLLVVVCGLSLPVWAQQPETVPQPLSVWVDTDGAADDLRAICMLMAMPQVDMLAVTTSEGALLPTSAAQKARGLLDDFGRGNVPVGVGRELNISPPRWGGQSENIRWSVEADTLTPIFPSAVELIARVLADAEQPICVVALGSLTNPADVLSRYPELVEKIERIVWYNGGLLDSGANYEADTASAQAIFGQAVKLEIISAASTPIPVNDAYIGRLESCTHPCAQRIVDTHRRDVPPQVITSGHMKAWDDIVALYLIAPALYIPTTLSGTITAYTLQNEADANRAVEAIMRLFE